MKILFLLLLAFVIFCIGAAFGIFLYILGEAQEKKKTKRGGRMENIDHVIDDQGNIHMRLNAQGQQNARREAYRRGLLHGRQIQKRHDKHDRYWNYVGVATVAGFIGVWLGIIIANWNA